MKKLNDKIIYSKGLVSRYSFMSRFLFVLVVISLTFVSTNTLCQEKNKDVFSTIMSNVCNVQWMDATDNVLNGNAIQKILVTQSGDGSWSDINYKSHRQTAWNPSIHLVRLHNMVLAYTDPKSKMYCNKELYSAIQNGLQYWYDADPRSSNWWNQQIFCPKQIGEMLILLHSTKQGVSFQLEQKLLNRMEMIGGDPDGKYSEGGSNRVNISAHWIYRGCLTRNQEVLEKGVKNYLLPLTYSPPGRGLQKDLSFQEHGRQLYIGNYGYSFIVNISEGALFLRNTPWELSGNQLQLFSDFVLHTYVNSLRGQYYSFSIPGRQIANKDALSRLGTTSLLDRMVLIDEAHKSEYLAAKERWNSLKSPNYEVPKLHKHFWVSDYTVHNRPNYNFDVRFVSSRTVRTENVNNENKKGFFLADGATNMTIRGDEYYNIFPVWDWSKIPGTTAPFVDSLPDMQKKVGGIPGVTDFCGGVSDSSNGVSTYALDYSLFKIKGKKSWFFFDNEIVCLGNSIQSTYDATIGTTVNQCLSHGKIQVKQNDQISTLPNSFSDNKLDKGLQWVLHDGFGYFFPTKTKACISNKVQEGSWLTISDSQKDEIVKEKVFTLWIDHGTNPSNENYAYIIVPNMNNTAQMESYGKQDDIKILSNTDSIQEVYNTKSQIKEAVLFKNNIYLSLDDNYSIGFDQPCLVILKPILGKWSLQIADPTQSLKEIKGTLYDKKSKKNIRSLTIILPDSGNAGSTVQVMIKP